LNRRIKKQIKIVRQNLEILEEMTDEYFKGFPEEEPTEEFDPDLDLVPIPGTDETTNWSTAQEEPTDKAQLYLKDLRDMTIIAKEHVIMGQIKTLFDLKSYVKAAGEGAGLVYRMVLEDETGEVTLIAFDEMAENLRQYTVGQYLKITNAWKMQENKHGKRELHIGKWAKVEVVE
jgi:hypothetical protein